MRVLSVGTTAIHSVPFEDAARGGGVERKTLPILRAAVDGLPPGVEAILACSDLQGLEPSTSGQRAGPRSARAAGAQPRLLGELVAAEVVDLARRAVVPPTDRIGVFLAGDLYVRPDLGRRGGQGDVRPVWQAFARHFRWVVGVAGNHDAFGSEEEFWRFHEQPGIHFLDGDVVEVDGLRVAGVSGVIGEWDWPRRRPEASFVRDLDRVLARDPAVLLLHQGPEGEEAELKGHPAIGAALKGRGPLVVCGHRHWPAPLAAVAGTQVLNVHERAALLMPGASF